MTHPKPKIVFSDFDGTLTLGTALGPIFFEILDLCDKNNLPFIVVTGRSVQWSYFTLTHLPTLNFSIAEGGGIWVEKKSEHELITHLNITEDERVHLKQTAKELCRRFPVTLSADSSGRITDRAIELYEFEKDPALKGEVESFLQEKKLHFSSSSVHLNFWAGEVSKSKAMNILLERFYPELSRDELIYFGDSMNDESVFRDFPYTVGVANLQKIQDKLRSLPQVILKGEEYEGPHGVHFYLQSLLK